MASSTPLRLLCNSKAPNYRENKVFKDFAYCSKWPKVADTVIEATGGVIAPFPSPMPPVAHAECL
jgi:hypothetical protein